MLVEDSTVDSMSALSPESYHRLCDQQDFVRNETYLVNTMAEVFAKEKMHKTKDEFAVMRKELEKYFATYLEIELNEDSNPIITESFQTWQHRMQQKDKKKISERDLQYAKFRFLREARYFLVDGQFLHRLEEIHDMEIAVENSNSPRRSPFKKDDSRKTTVVMELASLVFITPLFIQFTNAAFCDPMTKYLSKVYDCVETTKAMLENWKSMRYRCPGYVNEVMNHVNDSKLLLVHFFNMMCGKNGPYRFCGCDKLKTLAWWCLEDAEQQQRMKQLAEELTKSVTEFLACICLGQDVKRLGSINYLTAEEYDELCMKDKETPSELESSVDMFSDALNTSISSMESHPTSTYYLRQMLKRVPSLGKSTGSGNIEDLFDYCGCEHIGIVKLLHRKFNETYKTEEQLMARKTRKGPYINHVIDHVTKTHDNEWEDLNNILRLTKFIRKFSDLVKKTLTHIHTCENQGLRSQIRVIQENSIEKDALLTNPLLFRQKWNEFKTQEEMPLSLVVERYRYFCRFYGITLRQYMQLNEHLRVYDNIYAQILCDVKTDISGPETLMRNNSYAMYVFRTLSEHTPIVEFHNDQCMKAFAVNDSDPWEMMQNITNITNEMASYYGNYIISGPEDNLPFFQMWMWRILYIPSFMSALGFLNDFCFMIPEINEQLLNLHSRCFVWLKMLIEKRHIALWDISRAAHLNLAGYYVFCCDPSKQSQLRNLVPSQYFVQENSVQEGERIFQFDQQYQKDGVDALWLTIPVLYQPILARPSPTFQDLQDKFKNVQTLIKFTSDTKFEIFFASAPTPTPLIVEPNRLWEALRQHDPLLQDWERACKLWN